MAKPRVRKLIPIGLALEWASLFATINENWQLTDYLEIIIIEIPKVVKAYQKTPNDEVLQWMLFLDNPEREELLIGKDNIDKLKNATVAVFGCGGVGSYAVEALARAGIGNFVLVDKDVVDVTNINRQLVADFSTIGMDKVEVEKERILKVNPDANVEIHKEFYCEENKEKLIRENYTYIVDAIDSVSSKLSLIITAHEKNVKIISAMGMGNKLDPTQIEVSDISKTSVCPLAKTIRKQLRAKGINHSKVVYSRELPNRFDKSEEYRRTTASISFVPSVCGLIIASQIVRDLIDEF